MPMTTGRRSTALRDGIEWLVWMVPLAILLVGTPVALAIAPLLWIGRLARSAW